MSKKNTAPLAGRGIVVTRPAGQAEALAGRISERGGTPIVFPLIALADIEDRAQLDALLERLNTFDMAIFVSPNAAMKGCEALRAHGGLPAGVVVAAVGRATARELQKLGVQRVIAPEHASDSEALLAMPALQSVSGKRIVIFRGVGGRALLRDTLAQRGAAVEYAECYRRVRPAADVAALLRAWDDDRVHAIVVTSSESLRNLADLLGAEGMARMRRTPLFVPHPRIAATAREFEVEAIVTAQGDGGIVAALESFFAHGSSGRVAQKQ